MITETELNISNQSYIHKDFYQIYPEILEIVNKITTRWSPDESNESDPGVVLLKLLGFVADKLNYNIDKNILEVFMPSCTQQESMRKLCDMMGYDMHYYRSATSQVSFMWSGDEPLPVDTNADSNNPITFNRFSTNITDVDQKVNYVLIDPVTLYYKNKVYTAQAIEGQLVDLQVNGDNILKLSNLDSKNRYYFPEVNIAENGVFIWDADIREDDIEQFWTRVTNLNSQDNEAKVWKFGYDSRRKLPFIQFSDDISKIIPNGLKIKYIRTTGFNGNISAQTLCKLSSDVQIEGNNGNIYDTKKYLSIKNVNASLNGADLETIDDAYNSFKKTVGTFDTLVTCRDYANAIYNLVVSDTDLTPLISNVNVTDIRSDINTAVKVATCDENGIYYVDIPCIQTIEDNKTINRIGHFDLLIYALNPMKNSYTTAEYNRSFTPNYSELFEIKNQLANKKCVAHSFNQVTENAEDIYCLKNYYSLRGTLITKNKVNSYEIKSIKQNINTALFKKFNARNVDFGEDIPYETLEECIQQADPRIKSVNLEEPTVETWYMLSNGAENKLSNNTKIEGKADGYFYKKLLAKNIIAGKLPLFNYDTRFNYRPGQIIANNGIKGTPLTYPVADDPNTLPTVDWENNDYSITKIKTDLSINVQNGYTVDKNEILQLIAPAFLTLLNYPAYTNYRFETEGTVIPGTPCNLYQITHEDPESDISEYINRHNNARIFRKSNSYILGINAGYLIDKKGFKYVDVTQNVQYISGYEYYGNVVSDEDPDYNDPKSYSDGESTVINLGVNASGNFIKANSEYQLTDNDTLYIEYTDANDDVEHVVCYTKNSVYDNGNDVTSLRFNGAYQGIIRPNFDLYDSEFYHNQGHSYTKNDVIVPGGSTNPIGLYSLGAQDSLDIRGYSQVILDKNTLNCYWVTSNDKLVFKPAGDNIWSKLLESGEYFIYTDESMNTLTTLGSGTVITLQGIEWYPNSEGNVEWILNENNIISIDSIANNGIGAFAENNWQKQVLKNTRKLKIEEKQILTLAEGAVVKDWALPDGIDEIGSDDFTNLEIGKVFKYDYQQMPVTELIPWKIRTRLILNCDSSNGQVLISNENKTQKITCYTSAWKAIQENDTEYTWVANPNLPGLKNLKEEVLINNGLWTTNGEIKTNLLLQSAAGELSTHTYTADSAYLDDISIMNYLEQPIYLNDEEYDGDTLFTEGYKLDLNKWNYTSGTYPTHDGLEMSLNLPADSSVIWALYYNAANESLGDDGLIISSNEGNTLGLFSESPWADNSYTDLIKLEKGLNVIQIIAPEENASKTQTINIKRTLESGQSLLSGSLILYKFNIIKCEKDSENHSSRGIVYKNYGLEIEDCDSLLNILNTILGDNKQKFYYNIPIDNQNYLDTQLVYQDDQDNIIYNAYAWTDNNNICKNFVISQIDTASLDNIEVARTSRVVK